MSGAGCRAAACDLRQLLVLTLAAAASRESLCDACNVGQHIAAPACIAWLCCVLPTVYLPGAAATSNRMSPVPCRPARRHLLCAHCMQPSLAPVFAALARHLLALKWQDDMAAEKAAELAAQEARRQALAEELMKEEEGGQVSKALACRYAWLACRCGRLPADAHGCLQMRSGCLQLRMVCLLKYHGAVGEE